MSSLAGRLGVADQRAIALRLTALWSLSESGLGGVMHALRLPMTGLLVGGLAVFWMALLARFSSKPGRAILGALGPVLAIKAIVSPHSPAGAYLAVTVQGFLGAAAFSLIQTPAFAAALVGLLAMAESAAQKLIKLTLIYGEPFWRSVDRFAAVAAERLGLGLAEGEASRWLVVLFIGLYAIGGGAAGWLAGRFSQRLDPDAPLPAAAFGEDLDAPPAQRRRWRRGLVFVVFLAFTIAGSSWLDPESDALQSSVAVIARALIVVSVGGLLGAVALGWLRRRGVRARGRDLDESLELLALLAPASRRLWSGTADEPWLRRPALFLERLVAFALRCAPSRSDERDPA